MATITSASLLLPGRPPRRTSGLFAEIRAFWRQFFARAFDPYRPELHYMRGPGPAWRAKHKAVSPAVAIDGRRNPGREGAQVGRALIAPPRALFRTAGACAHRALRATMAVSRTARLRAVIIAMNGPSHDAAALCNSR